MRAVILSSCLLVPLLPACDQAGDPNGGAADINGADGKADGTTGIEVVARLRPGKLDVVMTAAVPRLGYVFYVGDGTKVTLEVTHGGTQEGLDTKLVVYGPRLGDGSYPKTLATDDDGGYGKLSKISDLETPVPGFYLAELAFGPNVTQADTKRARLSLSCDGTCDTDAPIAPLTEDLKWFQRSAERRAASLQTYGFATAKLNDKLAAGAPANWAVILDVDETTLNNSGYQRSRADLGVGFSPGSWTAWVEQRAATAIDGVVGFTKAAKELGGEVVLVTNRKAATECAQTEDNLRAVGVSYDAIFCQVDVSDKNPRFAAIANGTAAGLPALEAIMYVGDNILDFPGLSQDLRTMDDSAFALFGDKYIQLANPMYGSFDKNLD